jgi:hypothetical protein
MTKIPRRVLSCTTHSAGCDCHEWQFEKMRMALRVIRTWAHCDSVSMRDIVAKCDEALQTPQQAAQKNG